MTSQARRWLYSKAIRVPLIYPWITNNRFRVERQLLKGVSVGTNTHKSIIHFSVNKAATQYTKEILRRSASENGLIHARINEYARHTDLKYLDHLSALEMEQYQHIFKPSGYLYSVFGGMIEGIQDLDRYHIVLMVRDPRDVITSTYYSLAYSHLPPGRDKVERFFDNVAFAHQAGIDKFAINFSEKVCGIYQRYLDLLVGRQSNVYITRYEDMMENFPVWLDDLLDYCELDISPGLRQNLVNEAHSTRPIKENISKHVRQATPGDYKRKLQQDTIQHLDRELAGILKKFEYN